MTVAGVIFPHQIFEEHPLLGKGTLSYLIEEPLFFGDSTRIKNFHKQKLVLHRASMKRFARENANVCYIDYANADIETFFNRLKKDNVDTLLMIDPTDKCLVSKFEKMCKKQGIQLEIYENPNFLTSCDENRDFYKDKKRYFQTDYYIWQRKRLGILIEGGGPQGGHWTYDVENRKKLPKKVTPPEAFVCKGDEIVEEAKEYVEKYFSKNLGSVDAFDYPTSHKEARKGLRYFLEYCLADFGPYQDAMTIRSDTVFHSRLSAPLNVGLLDPEEIIHETMKFARRTEVPIASLEGFLRQIIGWREFMRAIYDREEGHLRHSNSMHFTRKLGKQWYEGTLGIEPVDRVIRQLHRTAYAHHIDRLMVVGNFMLLCEIHPEEVYRWFMEMFIDSYDWVMLPNVLSMSQYSDAGMVVTKPYVSGSNYILKMSDYPKGEWCRIWDGLYWRFLHNFEHSFEKNPRMKMMYSLMHKMPQGKLQEHIHIADMFLKTIKG